MEIILLLSLRITIEKDYQILCLSVFWVVLICYAAIDYYFTYKWIGISSR